MVFSYGYTPHERAKKEKALFHKHSLDGYNIVKDIDFPCPIAEMILQHHERLDGSGYPNGLRGDEILFEVQIIAVADVVEAKAHERPYRAALGIERALREIEKYRGTRYNPQIVDACVKLFKEKKFSF